MRLPDLLAAAGLALTFTMAGCYEESGTGSAQAPVNYDEVDSGDEVATDEALTEDALIEDALTDDQGAQPYGNSSSTLGKAKDSAKRTIGDLEAHDRELQKQIDDQNP